MRSAAAFSRPLALSRRSLGFARTEIACAAKYKTAGGEDIKSALSAYMHFCAEKRAGVTTELRGSLGEKFQPKLVMSKLGEMWRGLDEAKLSAYQKQAAADKVRFEKDLSDAGIVTAAQAKKNAKKEDAKNKPLSAYMIFCQDRRPSVTEQLKAKLGDDFKYTEVMVKLGADWKTLDEPTKAGFKAQAEAQKAAAAKK